MVIDADKLRVFLDHQYHNCHGYMGNKKEIYREALLAVKSYIHREKQIDAEPVRHGHWINAYPDIEPNPLLMYGICSNCGFEQGLSDKLNYCPNCGSKMDGGAP